MEKILIFIKHHIDFLWKMIEGVNGLIFFMIYKSKLNKILPTMFDKNTLSPFYYRKLVLSDADSLHNLIKMQNSSDLEYFHPHDFDIVSIRKQLKNCSFLMMGAFHEEKMIGYFFLRFFINRQCFVGRLIAKEYRGKGIGTVMNDILYKTAWSMNFRCLSTISRDNIAVMRAHAKNPAYKVIKELNNNYMLVEFVKEDMKSSKKY